VTSECEGHVARWSIAFNMCCCVEMGVLQHGHVTWLVFETRVLFQQQWGMGVETRVLGCVASAWGIVPGAGGCIVGVQGLCVHVVVVLVPLLLGSRCGVFLHSASLLFLLF
jgi:hypothetical protein